MECPEYAVMSRFPLLSASKDLKKWSGFISTATGKTVLLSLNVPEFPYATQIQLVADDLHEKAIQFWSLFLKQIPTNEGDTFLAYLESLEAQVVTGTKNADNGAALRILESEIYSKIIEEIEAIGLQNVIFLSPDFREITIHYEDKSGRDHQLKLTVPEGYPLMKPDVRAELPFPEGTISWPSGIKEIYEKFSDYAEISCQFWDDMEDLDRCVRVLDPIQPNKSHFHRKILLQDNVIMHLVFNASTPRAIPTISFAGPEKHVTAYNAVVDEECNTWEPSAKVLHNLKSMLNCEFASMGDDDIEEDMEEQAPCPVCYVYNFEGEIPEIACDCGAIFHQQCIHDLFVSDVTKTGLRRTVECPSCQFNINVPTRFGLAGNW